MFFMTQTVIPFVKLYVANSYYYNCGMLLTISLELPTDESKLKETLKEIQTDDSNGYIVTRGETQFKCSIPQDLDIFELNRKLKKLTDKDKVILNMISRLGIFSLTSLVDQVLSGNYKIYENVTCEEDLGRKLYKEGLLPFRIPVYLENYIDFRKLGHDACVKNSILIIPEMNLAERLCIAS
jgi:hypothetical protein